VYNQNLEFISLEAPQKELWEDIRNSNLDIEQSLQKQAKSQKL